LSSIFSGFSLKVAQEFPENFLLISFRMLEYASVLKNMVQFFFPFPKTQVDEHFRERPVIFYPHGG
jgi:hypothetical protein